MLSDIELQARLLWCDFATMATAKDAIATLPGYAGSKFFLFAKMSQVNKYAPRGDGWQLVSVFVRCQFTLKMVERWIVVGKAPSRACEGG